MNKFEITISTSAIIDIQNGIDYYKKIEKTLAIRFLNSVKASFNELKKSPYYQIKYKNVRIKNVKRFPYIIHFIVDKNQITIHGVRFAKMEVTEVL